MIFVISYIHHPLPPSHSFNLSFESLGWHPVSSALTSFWLHERFPCTWYLCLQTNLSPCSKCVIIRPQCSTATFEVRLCTQGRHQKKTTAPRFRVKSSFCHSASGYIRINKLNRARESMGLSLPDVCDCTYSLIINLLTGRFLTHASWYFPRSWPDLT